MIKKAFITTSMLLSMHTLCMYVDGLKVCADGTYMDTKTGTVGKFNNFPLHAPVNPEPKEEIVIASEQDEGYIAEDEDLMRSLALITLKQILEKDNDTDSEPDQEGGHVDAKPTKACLMRSPSSMTVPHKVQSK